MTEVGLESAVEIKRSKRLKGQPILQGDGLAGFQALLLSCLAEGPSRLENLPTTPWFQDVMEDFIRMGYAQQALDGQWLIHGGNAPVSGPEPLRVRHEAELLPLAAFLASQGCQRTLEVNTDCVSGEALEILEKILLLEKTPVLESHLENEDETFLVESPKGLTPRAMALLRPSPMARSSDGRRRSRRSWNLISSVYDQCHRPRSSSVWIVNWIPLYSQLWMPMEFSNDRRSYSIRVTHGLR